MPVNEQVKTYYTLNYPHLIYCVTVWGGSYALILKPVMALQNMILRAIFNAGLRAFATPIYQRFKLLKLEEIVRYMVGAYVFKTLNCDRPYVFEYKLTT